MASRNPLTPEQRRLRSQIANAARWSRVPPSQRAAQADEAASSAEFAEFADLAGAGDGAA